MTRSLRRPIGFVVAAITLTASMAGTAHAQANCAMYGKLAIQQQKENLQRNCGFSGVAWSTDLRGHIAWCAKVGPAQWKAELQRRASMLKEQCGG